MRDLQPIDRFEFKLRRIFQPDDGGDIVEWLRNNIKQIPFSPMPAGFNPDETPWLKEPLRAIANDEFRIVQIIAPIQSGKSLMAELLSCYILTRVPAPTLYLHDTDDNADNWIMTRLKVLWDNCPPVKEKIGEAIIKNRHNNFSVNGISFWCNGAHNLKNLQGKSIRWLVGDETWLWKKGHINEALARVTSFGWLGKAVFMSQGSFAGDDTHELWNTTTQNEWWFGCPECGHQQPWKWTQLRLPENHKDEEGEWNYNAIRSGVVYECEGCKHRFKDSRESRMNMNANGFYKRMNPNASDENQSFRWNALCARNWGKIIEARIRAEEIKNASADTGPLAQWEQKQMGEFWSDAPDAYDISQVVGDYLLNNEDWSDALYIDTTTKRLNDERGAANNVPARFMTVDVQRNGFYCLVRQWGKDYQSRLYNWRFIEGDQNWKGVKDFQKACGVHDALTFLDVGDRYDDVIRNCGINGWTGLRGDARSDFLWRVQTSSGIRSVSKTYSAAKLVNAGSGVVRVHHFSNLALKDQLTRLRKLQKHTIPPDVGKEYLVQMESEVRVLNENGKPEWRRIGKRNNHLWDCEVMQLVPAMAFGLLVQAAKPVDENSGEYEDEQPK
jgi:phage terminase large subunit GpA-like protein